MFVYKTFRNSHFLCGHDRIIESDSNCHYDNHIIESDSNCHYHNHIIVIIIVFILSGNEKDDTIKMAI